MTRSDDARKQNVYTIPPGAPFAIDLARGLWQLYADPSDPLQLASVTLLLPTRRAVRALRDAFVEVADGKPLILPAIRPIGDVDEEQFIFDAGLASALSELYGSDVAPPISSLRRQLLLTQLVSKWAETRDQGGEPFAHLAAGQAIALAGDLARFMDTAEREEVSLEGLGDLVPEVFAEHWGDTLTFLKVVTENWPLILADENASNPAAQRSAVLHALAASWAKVPPPGPVVLAGSTGSIPATAALMSSILDLPQGLLVLPRLDQTQGEATWQAIDQGHAQFGLKELLERLTLTRGDVRLWPHGTSTSVNQNRTQIIQQALRPAETTEGWRDAVTGDARGQQLEQAFEGFARIEAAEPGEEAKVIATVLRHALETPGQTAALVTPDRALARRVVTWLTRWRIDINDSAGLPLEQTPPATFLKAIIECADSDFAPVELLALLKHPLCHLGLSRPKLRALAAELEMTCLRGPRPAPGLAGLIKALAEKKSPDDLGALIKTLAAAFKPLSECAALSDNWATLVHAHIEAAESLAHDLSISGAARLWAGEAGEAACDYLNELLAEAQYLTFPSRQDYAPVFAQLMAGRVVRPRFGAHPRLFIWGPLEARLQSADVLVLGGLNENTWPGEMRLDPWLSRPMAKELGLASPERRIGLAAHDFAQLAASPQVIITRSIKQDGAPTVPSRWLMRLENMLKGLGAEKLLESDTPYLEWARALDRPSNFEPVKEPQPCPPFDARPRELSVTSVETWIRDPYGLYAGKILGLKPLEPIDADATAMERGIIIHHALEQFIAAYPKDLPADALAKLLAIGREVFEQSTSRPDVMRFWWPRFEAVAEWFVTREGARRPAIMPFAWEVKGQLLLNVPAGDFKLTARADRFDHFEDGTFGLYDYKTGRAPTTPQVLSGLAPQLSLEALIATDGGFAGLGKAQVSQIAYLELRGGDPAGQEKPVRAEVDELIARARAGLLTRITLFDDPATPYPSRVRPMFVAFPGSFDHLARVKEWSVYGQSEGGSDG